MQIGSSFGNATSGLRFQAQRLTQSAENVANINTDGFEARRVTATATGGGGVVAHTSPTYAPHANRVADDGATTALSNTDIADETVTQLSSLRSFQANIAVLKTLDEVTGSLLDIKA